MRAVAWTAYGPPSTLELVRVPRPAVRDHDVLIEVRAATVSAGDTEVRQLRLPRLIAIAFRIYVGVWRPRRITVLGQEVSGVIAAVGSRVTKWRVGDEVVAALGLAMGGYAEYVRLDENAIIVAKPTGVTHEAAAVLAVGGVEALQFLRQAQLEPGQSVLINGAAGSIGTIAVQLAELAGAHVTAIDVSSKHDVLRSIGAHEVLEPGDTTLDTWTTPFDALFDVVGAMPVAHALRVVKRGGTLLVASPRSRHSRCGRRRARFAGVSLITQPRGSATKDLAWLSDRVAVGALVPVVGHTYPLERAAEAHLFVESGMKRGGVVLALGDDAGPTTVPVEVGDPPERFHVNPCGRSPGRVAPPLERPSRSTSAMTRLSATPPAA